MAYTKRYALGFNDSGPGGGTPADSQFLNAVEAALLALLGVDASAGGQALLWNLANLRYEPGLITNANIDPAAAIARSKLGALGIVDADIAGGANIASSKLASGIPINKLNGYPGDPGQVPVGDGSWQARGAAPATAISGLPAGADGLQAKLRILPTTTSVGSQALPAGTINLVDTSQLPTAGVVSTPNGDLTYTGKTTTTLTGVTGGTGTLTAGSLITYKSGAYTTPNFDVLALVWDATLAKWVSPEKDQVFNYGAAVSGAAFAELRPIANAAVAQQLIPMLRLRDYVNAGLALQARFVFWAYSQAPGTGQIQASYSTQDAHANESARTALTSSVVTIDNTGANQWRAFDSGWCDLSGATLKDFITFGVQIKSDGVNNTGLYDMLVKTRWVG